MDHRYWMPLLMCAVLASPETPGTLSARAAGAPTAPQEFRQEVPRGLRDPAWFAGQPVQMLDYVDGKVSCYVNGTWRAFDGSSWTENTNIAPSARAAFHFTQGGEMISTPMPGAEVLQLLRSRHGDVVLSAGRIYRFSEGAIQNVVWPELDRAHQAAISPEGTLYVAAESGLRKLGPDSNWEAVSARDASGRDWGQQAAFGVGFDSAGGLWFATKSGVARRVGQRWTFFEPKDGVPVNDFTCAAAGHDGEVWFGTKLGVVRFDGTNWHYRQGPRWLPHDHVRQVIVDSKGTAWCATAAGVGALERLPTTLENKAEHYEKEIEQYIKRTPFGFVAEAALKTPGDRSSAAPQDSDNDGLWTAMYGAGECFGYAATKNPDLKDRARKAFEALRFLQKVTQGGPHSPRKGYVARTIRPVDWPDPNAGRLEHDKEAQKSDKLWKVYEPRWPKSADGKWYWKSDTSSDELDGHYFFYPLYYEFCAQDDAEKERVREVVRDLTDHLIAHDFALVDHDGKPTRWGIYGPHELNKNPDWWQERGLKSLSILSYLAVAHFVTGDEKYGRVARTLIDQHGYGQNAMHPKVQHGPGSGNQSDDEMAFMCFYTLLRYSPDDALKDAMRVSFYRYWVNEAPEMNPFFNFAYAALCTDKQGSTPFGTFSLAPWAGWHEEAMATLRGFPLDRRDWPSSNSHRLDIVRLLKVQSADITDPDQRARGQRVNGKVLPVENRHFGHWNTDPWRLDYTGNAGELSAGTVFLLPYYMGMYHGYIRTPE